MNETKIACALLAGLAAGAALGILLAPDAGTETRDKLSESLTNLGGSIKETAYAQVDKLVDGFQEKIVKALKEHFGISYPEERADDLEHA